ncbi:S8 family serine peptidase [Luteolibacter soli]|uniref:S8 family serine peptidase n=1 Tax=Luteolibacter soli TaxID=3135280 RepID=A0ABU9ARU6_9BACT
MKRLLTLLALLLIALLLLLSPRHAPVTGSGDSTASTEATAFSTAGPDSRDQSGPERNALDSSAGVEAPADHLLATAKLLDRRELSLPGNQNRRRISQLVESSFKYPLLQVEETWQHLPDGRDKRLSRTIQVADHAMMRFPAGFDRAAVADWCARQGLKIRRKLLTDDVYLVQAPHAILDAVDGLISRFRADFGNEQLAIAEPDYLQFADVTPSDPSFSSLWGLHNTGQSSGVADADIDAPEAWSISTGSRDVIVGIIDSGIDGSHPDLAANMYTNPGEIPANGIDDDANGFIDDVHGWDFYTDDSDPTDGNGHGTHCAGTIGGVGDNLIGVAGVNWEVSLVALQFLSPGGSGSTSDAVDAVNYGRKLGVTLTSNSWGGGAYSATLEQAIRDAGAAGQLFIAAAGNDATDNDITPHYPSTYNLDNVIAVASTTRTDALSSFSCFGKTTVDLGAPGTDIYSTTPGNTYGTKSGTSMATPHVSGAAALLYAISPERSHMDIKEVLLQTADRLPALNGICVSGGRLNLHRAAEYVSGPRVLPSVVEVAELAGNGDGIASPGETITFDVAFKNVGSEPAEASTATLGLETPTPGVTVTGGPFPLSYLDPGELTGLHRFTIALAPNLPTPAQVPLKFTVTPATGESWTSLRPLEVHSFHRISGQVLRKDGLGAIGGAALTYSGPLGGTITTDADGHFDFQVYEGSYQLRATAAGYMAGTTTTVTLPPNAEGLELRLGKAQLSAAPESISVSLLAGDSTTRTVQITNDGNVPLQWQSTVASISANQSTNLPAHVAGTEEDPDRPGAVRVHDALPSVEDVDVDLGGVGIGMLTGSFSEFATEMGSRGASVTALTLPLGATSLNGISIVVLDDTASSLTAADIALLRAWTMAGGALFLEGDESVSMGNINALANGSGIQGLVYDSFIFETLTDIVPHEITENVTSIGASSYGAHCTVSGPAEALVRTPSGDIFAAASWLGAGRVFMAGNEIHYTSDWATGQTRLFVNQAVDWLAARSRWLQIADPVSGTLAPGETATVTLLFDASFVEAGIYQGGLVLTTDSPTTPKREIAVQLSVSDAPAISFDPAELVFPDSAVNGTAIRNIAIENPGTQPVSISAITINHPAFAIVSPAPLTLAPRQRLTLPVTFCPPDVGLQEGAITISSDDPTHPLLSAQLRGTGFTGALLNYSPLAFSTSTPQGTARTEQLLISNPGDMPLEWSVGMSDTSNESANDTDVLADLLVDLDRDYQTITSLIPGRYDFTDGVTGTNISDGGNDMYDNGNYLATNLAATTYLNYSDGKITASPASFGPGGRYFTRKYPGLFVFSAEMQGVDNFQITGGTGADSSGTVDGSELTMTFHGRTYRGFLKRTYGAGDPSINQLVIVEDRPGLGHSFPTDTNEDDHTVSGLSGTRRIHYLLYAGNSGSSLGAEEVARPVMQAFLQLIDPGLTWVYAEPSSGSIPAGGSTPVQLRFDASHANVGNYKGILSLLHSQAGRPAVTIPLAMQVTGAPILQVSAEALEFQPTSIGSIRSQALQITNLGSAPLSVQAALAGSPFFSLPLSAPLQLAAGETRSLAIHFGPEDFGEVVGTLTLTTNAPGQAPRQIGLHGSGMASGALSVGPNTLALSLVSGSSATQSLNLANSGASAVSWTSTVVPVGDGSLTKPLQGLKALVISSSSSYYDDLVARLKTEGADTSYINYSSLTAGNISGKNLIYLDGNVDYLSSSNLTLLRTWVMDGGSLFLADQNSYFSYPNSILAGSGITLSYWNSSSPAATFLPHPVTTGVTALPATYYYGQLTLAAPAVPIMKMGTATVGAISSLGKGRVACFGDDVFYDKTGVVSHLNLAVRLALWGSHRMIDWLELSPPSGTAAASSASPLQVTAKTTGMAAGEYLAEIQLTATSPAQNLTVPVRLTVTGTPDLETTPASITMPATCAGTFSEQNFTLENRGAATLLITGIDSSSPDFSIAGTGYPLSVPAFSSVVVRVRHQPATASGPLAASLTIHSNEPAQPALQVPVTGSAILPPVAALATPLPLQFTLAAGTTMTGSFTLANQGNSALTWSVPSIAVTSATDLSTALTKLDANQASVTAAIPYREHFDEGFTGSEIIDGGANLFDGGNKLSTDLSDSNLIYTDGLITAAPGSLGTSGQYFTRKYPGLFVFAADLKNVNEFRIRGNLGANGAGAAVGSSVLLQRGQVTYRGFFKRVQGPGFRTLHHLVIVEDKPGLSHSFASDTNDDAHTISGLAANTRLYHLVYVGSTGSVSDDAQVQGIMSSFLDATLGTPTFRTTSPASGTVAAGGSADVTVTANASGLIGGIYRSSIELATNDPVRPVVLVPVELTVIGTPAITLSRTTATFASVFAGANATTISATVTNSGTEVLSVSSLTIDAPFTVTPADSAFTLVPGASRTLTLGFNSPQVGTFQGKLRIASNAANTPAAEITLNGTATPPPLATTNATPYTVNLQGGLTTATRSFNISNPGGAALQWSASVEYTPYAAPNGKDLQGLQIGVISVFDPFLDYLEAALVARGATVTYLAAAASPNPTPYDVILLDQTIDSLSTAYIATLKTWIENGGCMMVTTENSSITKINSLMSGGGIVAATGTGGYGSLQVVPHPITSGITSLYDTSYPYLQFNLSGQAAALTKRQINSTTFNNSTVVGPQGKGWVIASTSVFYDVFTYNSTGNRKLTDQCFSWMAGRLRGFVTPTPVSGTTAIGATSTAGFTINSAGMIPGTYQATLKYTTNSPAQPAVTVPITIEVPTESTLLPNKSSITFASTKAGVPASTTLRVDHKGTVPVIISALELPEGFTATGPAFPLTLKGGASATFTVRFSPLLANSYGGNLRIISNAVTPPPAIPLSGTATLGPVLEAPVQLPPLTRFAGATSTLPLQVANAGPENLTWTSSVMNPSAPGTTSPVLAGLRVGVFANNHQSLLADLATWGATPTNIPTTAGLLTPAAYDTIIIDGRMTSLVSSHFSALREWVKSGGTLILEGGTYSSVSRLNSLIKDSGLSAAHVPVTTAQATGFAVLPLMQGVSALTGTDCEIGLAATGQASLLALLPDGRGFAAQGSLGQGRILALGQQLFSDARYTTGSARVLAANSLSVLQRGRDVSWLSCSATGGTLVPGASADFNLSFNSTGLAPGTYRRQLRLTSNDPLRPTVPLLAEMTVIAPWTIQPASLDFGAVMQGDLLTRTVLISGDNSEPITATASPLGAGPFQLHSAAQFPVVADTPVTLPLTFQPTAEGDTASTLNLETIAGTITIPLQGKGVSSNGFPLTDFSAWRSLHFPAGGPFTGLHDDPDGDGLDLGTEYVFLRDPLQQDAVNPIRLLGHSANGLRVGYTRRGTVPDSAILLDTSDDLSSWLPFVPADRLLHQNPDGSTSVEVEVPLNEAHKFFVRGSVGTR